VINLVRIIMHQKNQGNYQGCKSRSGGNYSCSTKPSHTGQKCAPDSNCFVCWLCPHNKNGFWKDKLTDPSILLPEEASKLIKLDILGEDEDPEKGLLSSEMRLLIMGNVWVMNQNRTCPKPNNQNSLAMEPLFSRNHIMDQSYKGR